MSELDRYKRGSYSFDFLVGVMKRGILIGWMLGFVAGYFFAMWIYS